MAYASLHGHRIGYRRAGRGPTLLLLHGIAGSSRTWLPAMQLLQRDFTVLAPDFFGHGESAKPPGDYSLGNLAASVRDLLHLLEIERVTVIGQSYGGGVALQFAYQFPERCERLVLVDAGGLGREVSWILRLATLPAAEYVMPVLFPSLAREWGDSVVRFCRSLGLRNPRAEEVWSAYRSLTHPENRQAFVTTMRGVIDPGGQSVSAVDRLYLAAHMPTLIVWGKRTASFPWSTPTRCTRPSRTAELRIMPGVGHFPHAEEPARFVEILEEFLHGTEPSHVTPEQMRALLRQGPH